MAANSRNRWGGARSLAGDRINFREQRQWAATVRVNGTPCVAGIQLFNNVPAFNLARALVRHLIRDVTPLSAKV